MTKYIPFAISPIKRASTKHMKIDFLNPRLEDNTSTLSEADERTT